MLYTERPLESALTLDVRDLLGGSSWTVMTPATRTQVD